ncbi:MAG: carbamoyltransferase HypF [Candidatus Hermodarchaeota archaeon]
MNNKKTFEINISGIVQGVGFRPFLFNLAKNFGLKGYLLNRGNAGVRLVLQGNTKNIDQFIIDLKKKKPSISFIENIEIKKLNIEENYLSLEIKNSEYGRGISLTLPPDISICDQCLDDMRNSHLERYFQYPFIACAECGPRFTTVSKLPYDRIRTTMNEFPLCNSCMKEYSNFDNRRFHAQTFACSQCGPNYVLYDKNKVIIQKDSIIGYIIETAKRINSGEVAAVKGIGGVHLVCRADDDDIVKNLRNRKGGRKFKPFALMIPNLEVIENNFKISQKEKEILTSYRRPIVLLERKSNLNSEKISNLIAPGLNNVGVMLPYTGIHHLLFNYIGDKPLIYTSGNRSNVPMAIENEIIFEQLKDLADIFLLHNRSIYQRIDDSVLRIHNNRIKLIRRSRGYVPEYLPLPFKVDLPGAISTGPLLTTTGAILRRNRIFPTQHIGNITNLETYEFLKDAIFHMKNLLLIEDSEISFIATDAHPTFISTKLGKDLSGIYNCKMYQIQHHFAHILGLMAENKIGKEEAVVGISTDGVGYGDDGNVWGGEILLVSYNDYKRLSHLEYQPMIGGDRCTKYPARMFISIILKSLGVEEASKILKNYNLEKDLEYGKVELNTIISQFERTKNQLPSENTPLTSSTGRIFDTVSYMLGVSNLKTYRGEPAMRLEGLASQGNPNNVPLSITSFKKDGIYIIDTSQLILDILSLLKRNKNKKADIAAKFQVELANIFAEIALSIARENDITKIGLSGGVAYNYSFSNAIKIKVNQAGFTFLEHEFVPPGDAGISIGQLIGGLFKFLNEF